MYGIGRMYALHAFALYVRKLQGRNKLLSTVMLKMARFTRMMRYNEMCFIVCYDILIRPNCQSPPLMEIVNSLFYYFFFSSVSISFFGKIQ